MAARDYRWMTAAACRGMDPAFFVVSDNDTPGQARAKRVCADCTVVDECLSYALAVEGGLPGVFGGMTERERTRYRERMRRGRREDVA